MHYAYILQSVSHPGRFYYGSTVNAIGSFQHTIGLTMDAQMFGKPKDTGRMSKEAVAESVLRLGYCDGGDSRGDVGITLVAENRRDLMDSMNQNVISRSNVAQIPKDYRFIIEKTMRRNYATDRASTEYVLVKLERTGSRI
ncbi:MAG: hypothetical protein J0M04_10935 [Verrucomicrobia bacterium]|nr:hypothetical protein [Verrucomicrobiota bacterium]